MSEQESTHETHRTEHRKAHERGQEDADEHALSPSPDLLERNFTADGPNKKWLCDLHTFRRTKDSCISQA